DGVTPPPVYFAGGLGVMTINAGGSVTGDEGGLYLGLINGDTLAFNGGSMIANSVQVGIGAGTATLNIGEDGDVTMLGDLIVGDASGGATGNVTVEMGTLTLADPTPATEPGGDPTTRLTINGSSSLTLSNEGTLVTNSQNLWKQAANEVIDDENPLENNIGGKQITVDGGFIELTAAGVEASSLTNSQAEATIDNVTDTIVTFIITGQLLQAGKNVGSILPFVPPSSKVKDNALGYTGLMPNGGILSSTALNATTQSFPSTDGKTTTTYQNLVIGGASQGTLWEQGGTDVKNSLWTIDPAGTGNFVGFSSIQLSENGNILVTGSETLVLTGTGPTNEIVSGTGELNIYVGYQNAEGTLIFGGDENIAKGGTFNGDITVNNGGMEVLYGEYTVNVTLTLGVAQSGSSATATATTPYPGSLDVENGTLKVQSIAGNNVGQISISGGTLDVGEMSATLVSDEKTELKLENEGQLIVGQDLILKAANTTATAPQTVDMRVTE
ncbi:MAG: hypothetical protein LUD38_18555, partial [Parabacteroides sp.]|nr:hypothetical protein [Parabacteroides sp.]